MVSPRIEQGSGLPVRHSSFPQAHHPKHHGWVSPAECQGTPTPACCKGFWEAPSFILRWILGSIGGCSLFHVNRIWVSQHTLYCPATGHTRQPQVSGTIEVLFHLMVKAIVPPSVTYLTLCFLSLSLSPRRSRSCHSSFPVFFGHRHRHCLFCPLCYIFSLFHCLFQAVDGCSCRQHSFRYDPDGVILYKYVGMM